MPVISYFFGIYIRMYHDDHNPPHIHVEYQGHEALLTIKDGKVLTGTLPNKVRKIVQEWMQAHQQELLDDWQRAVLLEPLLRIPGADND